MADPTQRASSPLDDLEGGSSQSLAGAEAWVQENQIIAMLAAFAVGTFIGVMMRS